MPEMIAYFEEWDKENQKKDLINLQRYRKKTDKRSYFQALFEDCHKEVPGKEALGYKIVRDGHDYKIVEKVKVINEVSQEEEEGRVPYTLSRNTRSGCIGQDKCKVS